MTTVYLVVCTYGVRCGEAIAAFMDKEKAKEKVLAETMECLLESYAPIDLYYINKSTADDDYSEPNREEALDALVEHNILVKDPYHFKSWEMLFEELDFDKVNAETLTKLCMQYGYIYRYEIKELKVD